MGHSIIHTLILVIKQLTSNFDVDKEIKPAFCNACQFYKCHMQHFLSIEATTS